ncbi:N-6 DNA methylase [Faecalibacterium prausnitzii]|uniref:site-specific DNA-methyltransferase (adenine-specific) n=1 Tax=Faecalibacterium prausnitzii TaxID=853 RepID=A0A329UFU7_9FIRM|nr:restriction endonuclease subunit M [Faecalibacterium prausnitzii]
MPNDKITAVGANIAEKAAMIWNVADMLRGPFKPHEYGLVILPMTVVKRFHDCLLPTHQAVLDTYEKVKKLQVIDGFLQKASGYQFYNISRFTFETLLADPDNIESNFRDYLSGFSANAQDVLAKFDFDNIIKRMVESNTLYLVIKEFGSEKGYLGPDKISAVDCGYIFEDLVRRFSESFGEEAGAHFTSRDIIYLMTDLLLSEADLDTSSMTVYDMAMGTSQMLSCMEERIHELNSDIEVTCFGQEFNPSTFAIAKADMMIRGGDPNNMRFGDTLSEDQFPGFTFQYIISNPPFGIDWKREQKAVEAEAARGEMGRFAPGLPKISDGQQLFVLNGLAKLANKGKMAIIQNGSPLFSGDAGSGPSNIRQYILENDWLDCIIQLSTDMFMNTGISTYIWVLSKDKPAHRAGKVQLIDASHCFEPRRKSIGTKRNDITDACRELIVTAYGEFANGKVYGDKNGIYCESKVFESVEFGYNKIVVERPQRDEAGNVILKRGKPVPDTSLRDTENVPLVQDIDAYFAREVLPYAPDAWIDHSKTKVGYEIPMTRYFYEYQAPEAVEDIVARITALEQDISAGLAELFHKEGCVTKGVRGEREMKDSGVEWIGEINHRFSLIKLKYICSILDQYRKPISADKRSQSGSVLYDYYGASGAIDKIDDYTIDDHVMLIGEDGANLRMRNLPLMYEVNGKAWINNHAHILKPTEQVDFYYLFYALEELDINPYITGSAQPKLSQEKLQNIWVPLPDLEEQQEIATYIRSKCAEIDKLIAKKEQLIKELESYKKSLIYEVVTGKREV